MITWVMDISTTVKQINKQFGDGTLRQYGATIEPVEVISTGSLTLDRALDVGGLPRGRITEIYGPPSCGKTSLALHVARNAQLAGGTSVIIDAEHAFDAGFASELGVDMEAMLVCQPDSGEQALTVTEALVVAGADCIIVDSVAALVPEAEIKGEYGEALPGLQARMMSQAMRKLTPVVAKSRCVVIFINQIRMKIGVLYGSPETTAGGEALKFYASVRLDMRRSEQLKDGKVTVGNRSRVKVVKNKVGSPYKVAEFDFHFEGAHVGIDRVGELLDLAVEDGLIERRGAFYSLSEGLADDNITTYDLATSTGNLSLGQGKEAALRVLRHSPTVVRVLEERILS